MHVRMYIEVMHYRAHPSAYIMYVVSSCTGPGCIEIKINARTAGTCLEMKHTDSLAPWYHILP